ncbi:hypothetical protein DXG01_003204 [Tephrocybe rancida]|nr:hypothetical protein DXG01_003204 [Tephrocybe rancida]
MFSSLLPLMMFSSLLSLVSTSHVHLVPDFHTIHPDGDTSWCLDVGGPLENGSLVQIYECNGSAAQKWNISRGKTTVQLHGTRFCLDAGSTPANFVVMKIWECFDGLPAQTWFYTDDNRIALLGKGLCLTRTYGYGNRAQTRTCTDGDHNQVWTLG